MEDSRNIILACEECSESMYPNRGKLDVGIGEYAKLKFVDKFGAEYMWVKVTKVDGDRYEGNLNNDPIRVRCVEYGDKIEFRKEDIFDKAS